MIVWVPCVLIGIWATSDLIQIPPPVRANPNLILPFMVKRLADPILGGFLSAGILAAIMSSLDSQFLCIGTMFTEDIVVHYGSKNRFTDRQVVMMARGFIIAIVLLTYFFSLFEPRGVFTLGVWCFSGFASLFPLIFATIYWKRLTKMGAYASILAAFGTWCYLFYQSDFAAEETYAIQFELNGSTYQVMPVLLMFISSLVALVVVSTMTRPPSKEALQKFFPDSSAIS
jgi:SSS family solute:Na+ symporter